jgi:transposase
LYFEDESPFGLFTKNGKALTARGVKPICPFQQVFQSTYLFGAFSPINGASFLFELPFCNTEAFQLFLNEFSAKNLDELKIMVLDNGAFHKAKRLIIPKNILLILLPPFSPELNPAEKMWAKFKRAFTNRLYKSLDEVSLFIQQQTQTLKNCEVKTTCTFEYIFFKLFLDYFINHFGITTSFLMCLDSCMLNLTNVFYKC